MQESIVARQPILNSDQNVIAFEIIFKRTYDTKIEEEKISISAEDINNDVEFIEQKNLSNGKKIFINFTGELLKSEIADLLSTDNLGIEISKNIIADDEITQTIENLKKDGALIILNDISPEIIDSSVLNYSDIIKIDFNKYDNEQHKILIDNIKQNYNNIKFLADNINEHKQFEHARNCGYDYFQGIFFTKPDVVANREMPGYKLNYLNFLKELNKEDLDFDHLEKIIKNDISMSVSLLRTINAAYYGYSVSSIKQAATLLGINGLRKWSLIYLAEGLRDDKPDILFVNTLTRAEFAESVAEDFDIEENSGELFTMGMFSMMDAFLNRPIEDILDEISLNRKIKEALTKKRGIFGEILELVIAFERSKWEEISVIEKYYKLDSKKLYNKYLKAVDFAYETMNLLMEHSE